MQRHYSMHKKCSAIFILLSWSFGRRWLNSDRSHSRLSSPPGYPRRSCSFTGDHRDQRAAGHCAPLSSRTWASQSIIAIWDLRPCCILHWGAHLFAVARCYLAYALRAFDARYRNAHAAPQRTYAASCTRTVETALRKRMRNDLQHSNILNGR
jgi:hypothetical protein